MSAPNPEPWGKPWTFLPFEMDHQDSWPIYDENLGRIVATFYDQAEAESYLEWRNRRQAKLERRRDRESRSKDKSTRWSDLLGRVRDKDPKPLGDNDIE